MTSEEDFENLLAQGKEQLKNKDPESAVTLLKKAKIAAQTRENKLIAEFYIGFSYYEAGALKKSLEILLPLKNKRLPDVYQEELLADLIHTHQNLGLLPDRDALVEEYFDWVLSTFPNDFRLQAKAYNEKSYMFYEQGQFAESYNFNTKAIQLSEKAQDYNGLCAKFVSQCYLLAKLHNITELDQTYLRALEMIPLSDEKPDYWLGELYRFGGQLWQAESVVIKSPLQGLEILKKADKHYRLHFKESFEKSPLFAVLQYEISVVYRFLGDYQECLFYAQRGLNIAKEKQFGFLPILYGNIGYGYLGLKSFDLAVESFQEGLNCYIKINGTKPTPELVRIYSDLGEGYLHFDKKEAKKWFGKLNEEAFKAIDDFKTTITRSYSYGMSRIERGERAIEFAKKRVEILIEEKGEKGYFTADSWKNLADICKNNQSYEQAIEHYKNGLNALTIQGRIKTEEKVSYTDNYLAWGCLAELGNCYYNLSQNPDTEKIAAYSSKTIQYYQSAFDLIEENRKSYKAEQSKLNLNEEITLVSKNYMLALIGQNPEDLHEQLWQIMEKSKANLLQQEFAHIEAKDFVKDQALLEIEKELKWELSGLEVRLEKEKEEAAQKKVYTQYFEKRLAYQKILERIEQEYPQYHQAKYQPQEFSIAEIQKLLPEDGKLINYFFAENQLFLLLITEEESIFHVSKLPDTFWETVNSFEKAIKFLNNQRAIDLGNEIYNVLLRPVEIDLIDIFDESIQPLILIPHGLSNKIPFEALITDKTSQNYLIKGMDISYHYSASLWARQKGEVEKKKNQAFSFLGMAPVYEENSQENWTALPYSEKEVQEIGKLMGSDSKVLMHAEAHKENLLEYASQVKYLHLAAHFHQDTIPKLSGLILTGDERFYIKEAFSLNLSADLVVLSACESAVGELYQNEGMMAINRGFLTAGANNVVSTLFPVNDSVSTDLMIAFYKNLELEQNPAQALSNAKRYLIEKGHVPIKFWSAFVIFGK